MEVERARTTTILGHHAWLRSSGCWKCTRMYTLMATTTTVHTHATRMRNQLYPSVGMTATARARVAGSFKRCEGCAGDADEADGRGAMRTRPLGSRDASRRARGVRSRLTPRETIGTEDTPAEGVVFPRQRQTGSSSFRDTVVDIARARARVRPPAPDLPIIAPVLQSTTRASA